MGTNCDFHFILLVFAGQNCDRDTFVCKGNKNPCSPLLCVADKFTYPGSRDDIYIKCIGENATECKTQRCPTHSIWNNDEEKCLTEDGYVLKYIIDTKYSNSVCIMQCVFSFIVELKVDAAEIFLIVALTTLVLQPYVSKGKLNTPEVLKDIESSVE